MYKEGKMQNQKLLKKSTSMTHIFGYKYSKQTNKLTSFSQIQVKENKNYEEKLQTLKSQNQRLQFQLQNIKNLLFNIIHPSQPYQGQETIDQLLEQLLELVLSKCRQASQYKKQNELLKEELENLSKKSSSSISSQIIDSNTNNYLRPQPITTNNRASQAELQYSKVTNKNRYTRDEGLRWSQESTKTRSIYRPRVLFEIGKEVNTVNQLSSNNILKKQSECISSSVKTNSQLSFKQFKKLKGNGNRMSIEGSLYQSSQDEVQRINIYSSSHRRVQDEIRTSECLIGKQVQKNHLFQIEQQKNIDFKKEPQLKGLAKIPKRDRFSTEISNNFLSKR